MSLSTNTFVETNKDRLLSELKDFLRIPSISTLPEHRGDIDHAADGSLSGPRKRTAGYRGRRLTRLAGLLASERARRRRLEL